jgi:hypothetical protein
MNTAQAHSNNKGELTDSDTEQEEESTDEQPSNQQLRAKLFETYMTAAQADDNAYELERETCLQLYRARHKVAFDQYTARCNAKRSKYMATMQADENAYHLETEMCLLSYHNGRKVALDRWAEGCDEKQTAYRTIDKSLASNDDRFSVHEN